MGDDIIGGGIGHDTLYGSPGNDLLNGGAGNDAIVPGADNVVDTIYCGPGYDTAYPRTKDRYYDCERVLNP